MTTFVNADTLETFKIYDVGYFFDSIRDHKVYGMFEEPEKQEFCSLWGFLKQHNEPLDIVVVSKDLWNTFVGFSE